jgi:hypothetical protein
MWLKKKQKQKTQLPTHIEKSCKDGLFHHQYFQSVIWTLNFQQLINLELFTLQTLTNSF